MAYGYDLAVGRARKLAEKFGKPLRQGETSAQFKTHFEKMFRLTVVAAKYKKEKEAETHAAVDANIARLTSVRDAILANGSPTGVQTRRNIPGGAAHMAHFRAAPNSGKYVIFSDIHLTNRDNRQWLFERDNKGLYLQALAEYYGPRGYTLIENGDVEELLIFDPAAPEHQNMPTFEDIVWDEPDTWQGIIADRTLRKRAQFETIVREHGDYYQCVYDNFIARGAYYRTIGNHDTDLSSREFRDIVRNRHGFDWPTASDFVALMGPEGTVDYLICHGHQFDASCIAEHAPFTGESLSQSGGWAYEGPDRYWNHGDDGPLFLDKWLDGSKTFSNSLVHAVPAGNDQTGNAILSWLGFDLNREAAWEAIFTGNIAWEYFEHGDAPQRAMDEEVEKGVRWFKMRHMDEQKIVRGLDQQFGRNSGPTLVLGHSHEPRIRSDRGTIAERPLGPVANYLNSAAAGRFENLIWGIEIDNGAPRIISWSRDRETEEMVRTVWNDRVSNSISTLRAGRRTRHGLKNAPGFGPAVQEAINLALADH
ncbi:MAG: hypothetical protein KDE08_09155 [Rhodobacteraceae bacterium]|nr:hypothetical protein [Paracoccaceae bacterium]